MPFRTGQDLVSNVNPGEMSTIHTEWSLVAGVPLSGAAVVTHRHGSTDHSR
jgi:hypothetical protein